MPTVHRLSDALRICMYAKDHAPPHFHVVGPTTDFCVRLDNLEVLRGEYDRREFAIAVAWADEHLELLKQTWSNLNGRD